MEAPLNLLQEESMNERKQLIEFYASCISQVNWSKVEVVISEMKKELDSWRMRYENI